MVNPYRHFSRRGVLLCNGVIDRLRDMHYEALPLQATVGELTARGA